MVVKPLRISHKQVSLHVEKNDKKGVGEGGNEENAREEKGSYIRQDFLTGQAKELAEGVGGGGNEENAREKKGSYKRKDLNILTEQAKELANAGEGSTDTNLDVISPNFDDLKEKSGGGKGKSEEIVKSMKLTKDLDLIAFVLDICPVPAK